MAEVLGLAMIFFAGALLGFGISDGNTASKRTQAIGITFVLLSFASVVGYGVTR